MPEWLKGADCKSAGLPTLVQIQLGLIIIEVFLFVLKQINIYFVYALGF